MAHEAIELVNREYKLALVDSQLKAIREAYFGGRLTLAQASVQMTLAGIIPERQTLYAQQWAWERTEGQRMLSTGEVLSALKQSILTAPQAVMRLSNLGWSGPDALIEVQIAQNELASSAARAQATQARRQETELRAQEKAQQAQAAKAQVEQAKAAKAQVRASLQLAQAGHKKLMEQYTYLARLHADQAALDTAQGKGELEKVSAEYAKQLAAYQEWLLAQIGLAGQSPEVADETLPIETEPTPEAPPSPGAPGAYPAVASPAPTAPGATGGSGQPPTP